MMMWNKWSRRWGDEDINCMARRFITLVILTIKVFMWKGKGYKSSLLSRSLKSQLISNAKMSKSVQNSNSYICKEKMES